MKKSIIALLALTGLAFADPTPINEAVLDEVPVIPVGSPKVLVGFDEAEDTLPNGDGGENGKRVQQFESPAAGFYGFQFAADGTFTWSPIVPYVDPDADAVVADTLSAPDANGVQAGTGDINDVDTSADSNVYVPTGGLTSATSGAALDELASFTESEVSSFAGSSTSIFSRNVGNQTYSRNGYNGSIYGTTPVNEGEAFRIGAKLQTTGLSTELNSTAELLSSRTVFVDPVVGSDTRTYSVGGSNFTASVYDEFRPFKTFRAAQAAAQPEDNLVAKNWDNSFIFLRNLRQNVKVLGGDVAGIEVESHLSSYNSHTVDISGATLTGHIRLNFTWNVTLIAGNVDYRRAPPSMTIDKRDRLVFNRLTTNCHINVLGNVHIEMQRSTFAGMGIYFQDDAAGPCIDSTVTIHGDYHVDSVVPAIGNQSGLFAGATAERCSVHLMGRFTMDNSITEGRPLRLINCIDCDLILDHDFVSPYGLSFSNCNECSVKGRKIIATSALAGLLNGIDNAGHGFSAVGDTDIRSLYLSVERLESLNTFAFSIQGMQAKIVSYLPTHFYSGSPIAVVAGRTDLAGTPVPTPLPNSNFEFAAGSKFVGVAGSETFGITNVEIPTVASNGEIWSNVPEGVNVMRTYGTTVTDANVE